MDINTTCFVLLAIMLTGYSILDGFDLGVGAISLFARSRKEREVLMSAIDPVWDGNQVWLLTSGNVLFGAFPLAFATVFAGLYLAFMLLLAGIGARTGAIEFRHMCSSSRSTASCFGICGLGCTGVAVVLGAALGNVLRGMPIGPDFAWQGSALQFLNGYALLVGVLACSLFIMHGAIYLGTKTEGELSEWTSRIAIRAYFGFLVLCTATMVVSFLVAPFLFRKAGSTEFWVLSALLMTVVAAIPVALRRGKKKPALFLSGLTIALLMAVIAFSLYPVIVPSSLGPEFSLTVYNAASQPGTMTAILLVGLIGIPIMLGYTFVVYRAFRGPARTIQG